MEETKGTILIVDDEESIRSLISYRLKIEGYECQEVARGDEALWTTFMKDFDVVLLDIKMPGLSGTDVLKKMLIDHPDTSVIMITAVADVNTAVEAMRGGAYDYIVKPFDLEDLSVRVKRALERRKLILENREYQQRLEQKVREQGVQLQEFREKANVTSAEEQRALDDIQRYRES